MNSNTGQDRLLVVTVGSEHSFHCVVEAAMAGLSSRTRHVECHRAGPVVRPSGPWPETYTSLTAQAKEYLDEVLPDVTIELFDVSKLVELQECLEDRLDDPGGRMSGTLPWRSAATVLFLVDAASAVQEPDVDSRLDVVLNELNRARDRFGIGLSPYSVLVYDDLNSDRVYSRTLCTTRKMPDEPWVLAAEAVSAFTDLVQARHTNAKAMLPETEAPATLATELTRFLTTESGQRWGLHFFTGSIISKLIQDVTVLARRAGNPVLRGPNEHSLACGALARWQLQDAPFLIVVTSGMVDELKGTLANLRDSQARGFIVIGENEPGTWQPFQGTVHEHEDSRLVFNAYGLPCFYLSDVTRLEADLTAAFRAYHRRRGPVVLLASPSVLRHTSGITSPRVTRAPSYFQVGENVIDTIADLLNHNPAPVLWQCGKLDATEQKLVHGLARRAGIALVDSLGRPGTVARFCDGKTVDEYLGTMSLYACSPEVWWFLNPEAGSGHRDQTLFFLKSRVQDLSTPFPEKVLYDEVRIVQVTDVDSHIAPFTDMPVVEQLESFLRRLEERVNPEEGVVRVRREAMAKAREAARQPLAHVPSIPMRHEYFFAQLNDVLSGLISHHGYEYTGFYDVGRGGASAIRNLVRTGPGFSGWYGRALMGDALQAVPAYALTNPGNVLGFIGDGAANLVPSILPSLAQQLRYESGRLEGNVSIFFLLNGGFSIIRSYRELQHAATADAQMSLLTPVMGSWQQTWGDVTVSHERVVTVDPSHLAKRLLEPATVNLFSVYLAHDNEGDDIMPLSRKNWRTRSHAD